MEKGSEVSRLLCFYKNSVIVAHVLGPSYLNVMSLDLALFSKGSLDKTSK